MMVNSDFPELQIPQRPEVWELEEDKSGRIMRGGKGVRVLQK